MSEEKKCGMCECTSAEQWIRRHNTWICGACMQELRDLLDYDSQNCW